MKKLYKITEYSRPEGTFSVLCEDLVGTGRNWIEPARVLDIPPSELVLRLKNEFNAKIVPYRKRGKISFVGYSWDSVEEARKFKNYLNKVAREKDYKV